MSREIVGGRFHLTPQGTGSLGVVKDTIFRRCIWPKLNEPTALFAAGSSGIQVEGPPTPRNVVFPPDTVFLGNTRGDCHFLVEPKSPRLQALADNPRVANVHDRRDAIVIEVTAVEARNVATGVETRAAMRTRVIAEAEAR